MTLRFKSLLGAVAAAGILAASASHVEAAPTPGLQAETSLSSFWSSISGSWWNLGLGTYYGAGTPTIGTPTTSFTFPNLTVVTTVTTPSWYLEIFKTGATFIASGSETESTVKNTSVSNILTPMVPATTSSTPLGSTTTFTVSETHAVPGPIAGAGLPLLLGLAGYGALRRRKAVA